MVNDLFNGTRRDVILRVGAVAVLGVTAGACASQQEGQMATFNTRDDVTIYYKDWGPRDGEVVILSHGWPLNADSWEAQAFHLASNGFRVITHDRRGHGRSSPALGRQRHGSLRRRSGAADRASQLRNVSLFGFSTGGGEVARYIGRHGTSRVAQAGTHLRRAAAHAADRSAIRAVCRSRCSTACAPPVSPTARSSIATSPAVPSLALTARVPRPHKA